MRYHLVLACGIVLLAASMSLAAGGNGIADLPMFQGAMAEGAEACIDCHEDLDQDYLHTAHFDAFVPGTELGSCEACHGPGSLHVEEEGDGPIFGPTILAELGIDAGNMMCSQCHTAQNDTWHEGPHGSAELACYTCHTDVVHTTSDVTPMAEFRVSSEFCLQCHEDQMTDFRMPSRHRVLENEVACMDCHSPHGEMEASFGFEGRDEVCLTCHTEMSGPFVFEHEGVSSEDCTACHSPHGSINDKLLVQDSNGLCLQCHYEPGFLGVDAPDGFDVTQHAGWALGAQQHCYDCHVEIHGSNIDPNFQDR